jgi:putative nucleotidyltransferase with HDIG domain
MTPRRAPISRRLLYFTTPVIGMGLATVLWSLWQLPGTAYPLGWVMLGGLALVAATFGIKIPGVSAWLSISDTFFFASVLLFGPAPATVSIALDSLIMSWRRGHRLHQLLFNPTSSALSLWVGAQVFYAIDGSGPLALTEGPPAATSFFALACMTAVYFLLNSGLTVTAVGLDKQIAPLQLWRDNFAIISLNYFAAASAAFLLIVLMRYAGVTAMAAVLPLICICYLAMRSWLGRVEDANRHVQKIDQMYLSTIGAFSSAIEAKDGVTSHHVQRVQAYAMGLARALRITDPSLLRAIEAAALLHDTGKLAVPEHILNKPGKLTTAEFETMKTHVDVGADILSSIEFPYPVVPIVRAHHENWDGSGYPRGLREDAIPIGARILAVVDCFDALTSDRPYRPAMTEVDAIAIIVERRATMYDPDVVDTFLKVYREIVPVAQQQPGLQRAMNHIRHTHQTVTGPVATPGGGIGPVPDSSEEMLALVSLARVASGNPTPRDIGALAWGHLRQLAPGASCAIFTMDTTRGELVVQYAAGAAAVRLSGMAIEVGRRITGWVAAARQPMVNADATLDLDERAEDLRFAVSMPLVAESRVVGVMTLYAGEPFGNLQVRRLEMITPHLAAALTATHIEKPRRVTSDLRVVARR